MTTKTKQPKPKKLTVPKAVQLEIDEFKRTMRELEVHAIEQHAAGWSITVSAPKYGDADMLEQALSIGTAKFKRMEAIDQYTLEIHL